MWYVYYSLALISQEINLGYVLGTLAFREDDSFTQEFLLKFFTQKYRVHYNLNAMWQCHVTVNLCSGTNNIAAMCCLY